MSLGFRLITDFTPFIFNPFYPNISTAMLEYYSDLLQPGEMDFLKKASDYKTVFYDKVSLLFDPTFKRLTFSGTLALKLGILLNWY